jgi:trimethylamine--corrinoid protein Co-methyltransferase
MHYDVNPRRPLLEFWSNKELDEIHYASLEILERVGANIYHEKARELLHSAGAGVEDDLRVRIPSYLVEKALQLAPKRIILSNRLGERTIFLEDAKIYFGTGGDLVNTIDHETGERRKSVSRDVENAALVGDYLSNIDFIMGYGLPSDVHPIMQELYEFYAMMKGSVKPMFLNMSGRRDMLEYMYEMAIVVAGSPENLQTNPFFAVNAEPVAPLKHIKDGLEPLLFCSERRIPVVYPAAIYGGANAPVTMAGALALGNAETLVGLVVTQLNNPGAPFIYGGGGCCPLDMKHSLWPWGAPEWHIASAIYSQLSRRYGLSTWDTAGTTDSKTVDEQASIEGAYSLLMAALGGGNIIHDVGFLEGGLTGSLNFLVMMDEVVTLVKRILRNFPVDRETLAIDLIEEVGPGGDFFTKPHTLNHFKQELWYPHLLDRSNYDRWVKEGNLTLQARAQAEVKRILSSHQPAPLPEETRKELEQIIQSAERNVLPKVGG